MSRARSGLGAAFSYAAILCLLIVGRLVFSPLLLRIERELGLSHAAATSFFLVISLGYSVAMILSGFVARAAGHRDTILIATLVNAAALVAVAFSRALWITFPALFFIGAATGLYVPSGVASLYALFTSRDRGKAIGIHEVGASLAFVLAPLAAEAVPGLLAWRELLLAIAATGAALGILHRFIGRGGGFAGQPPVWRNLRELFSDPSFVVIVTLFALMLGAGAGAYSVLPAFLFTERGMTESAVNLVVSISRITGLPVAYLAGSLADRVSPRVSLAVVIGASGVCTILTGVAHGSILIAALFAQPVLTGAFFPIAFALLPAFVPEELRNVAVAMVVPFGYLAGGGIVPSLMGVLGELGAFWVGFVCLGVLLLAGLLLIGRLRPRGELSGNPAGEAP